jgi:hypothetical protein
MGSVPVKLAHVWQKIVSFMYPDKIIINIYSINNLMMLIVSWSGPALGAGERGGRPGPRAIRAPTLYVYGVCVYCVGVIFWSLAEVTADYRWRMSVLLLQERNVLCCMRGLKAKGQERNVCINSLSVFLPCGCRDAHGNSMPGRVYMHCASFQLLNVF